MNSVSDLDAWVDQSIRISAKHDYHLTAFVAMRARHGTVEAIRRLVSQGDIQSGFRRLKELGLKEWTIEQAVLRPEPWPRRAQRVEPGRLADAPQPLARHVQCWME
jgi:hypothetical protein